MHVLQIMIYKIFYKFTLHQILFLVRTKIYSTYCKQQIVQTIKQVYSQRYLKINSLLAMKFYKILNILLRGELLNWEE